MRIVVAVKYYPPMKRVSGIVGFLTVLLRRMAERHEVHVVTHRPAGDSVEQSVIDGVTVHRVRGSFPIAAARRVRALRPDIVVFVSGIFALRLAAPYFGVFRVLLGPSIPRVFMQATHPDRAPGRLMVAALKGTRAILTTSPDIADSFRAVFADRVVLFQPAIDLPDEPAQIIDDHPIRIGFINHFNEVKGADIAIDAIRTALDGERTATAIFAGTGVLEDAVESTFADNDRVDVRGFIEDAERLEIIRSCDIMVLPFRQAVSVLGVSQTVLEVMAAGRVVLGTETASITPAITHESNGVLSTIEHFTEDLVALMNDRDRLRRLGEQARIDAMNSWDTGQRIVDFVAIAESAQAD